MAQGIEQFEESEVIKESERGQDGDAIRSQIAKFLSDPYFCQTLDKESLKNYQDIVNKKGHIKPDDTENLSRFYEFMKSQWGDIQEMKKRITNHSEQAVKDKIITEKDRGFYKKKMKENVVNGKKIVTKEVLEKAEKELLESLDKRREEKKEYDDLVNSPLVQEGFLHVDKNSKIPIVDEDHFLKMSVPDRRKWLEKIRDAKPKAERYMDEGLNKEYTDLLEEARQNGWVGNSTIKKFKEAFNKIDFNEKKYWIEEIKNGNELDRYKKLWEGIRETLDENYLNRMEKFRDSMGYFRLSDTYESTMTQYYDEKLEKAFDEGWISKHTQKEFAKDMESQPLSEKQRYLKSFDQEMGRYKILRTKINVMKNGKGQAELNKMYESESYGYTEINQHYQELTGEGGGAGSQSKNEMQSILQNVQSKRVRSNIEQSEEALRQNKGDAEKMIIRLDDRLKTRDESDYARDVKESRLKKVAKSKTKKPKSDKADKSFMDDRLIKARRKMAQERGEGGSDDQGSKKGFLGKVIPLFSKKDKLGSIEDRVKPRQSEEEIETEMENMETDGNISVSIKNVADNTYEKTTVKDKDEKIEISRIEINKEEVLHQYLNEAGAKRQDHFLAREQGEIVELNLEDIRYFRDYLKASLNQKEGIKKAA